MYFNCFYCPMQSFCRQYPQGLNSTTSTDNVGTNSMPPAGPPPPFIPSKTEAMYETFGAGPGAFMIVDPSVIQTHMFRYVYIWLKNNTGFWGWINFIDGNYITGWRWNGEAWVPFKLEISAMDGIARF